MSLTSLLLSAGALYLVSTALLGGLSSQVLAAWSRSAELQLAAPAFVRRWPAFEPYGYGSRPPSTGPTAVDRDASLMLAATPVLNTALLLVLLATWCLRRASAAARCSVNPHAA
jgi:hypothetical protein